MYIIPLTPTKPTPNCTLSQYEFTTQTVRLTRTKRLKLNTIIHSKQTEIQFQINSEDITHTNTHMSA